MNFKTVNFNIFDENLQEIVYGERSASRREENVPAEGKTARLVRKVSEIVIRPLNETRREREKR